MGAKRIAPGKSATVRLRLEQTPILRLAPPLTADSPLSVTPNGGQTPWAHIAHPGCSGLAFQPGAFTCGNRL